MSLHILQDKVTLDSRLPDGIDCLRPLLTEPCFRSVVAALESVETNHPMFQLDVFLQGRLDIPLRLRPSTKDLFTLEEVFVQGIYAAVIEEVDRVSTIIDLGANIGLSSVYFLDAFQGSDVFAVEPDPVNFELLKTNLKFYGARAKTLQGGLWQLNSKTVFARSEDPRLVNEGKIIGEFAKGTHDSELVVDGFTIISLIEKSGFKTIDLLKVDIEGNEEVLFSGPKDWLTRVRCIAIEFHHGNRFQTGFDGVMSEYGFTITEPNPHTVLAIRKS